MSTTFILHINGKHPERKKYDCEIGSGGSDPLFQKYQGKVIMTTRPRDGFSGSISNSLVSSIYDAYANHCHLVIRPDDVWLSIVIALSNYLSYHSEKLQTIQRLCHVVSIECDIKSDWYEIISKLADETPSDLEWMVPDFTTTTKLDKIIGKVAMLGATKRLTKYQVLMLCGIPGVTLKGTIGDWYLLRQKINQIKTFGEKLALQELEWWSKILTYVVDNFIKSYVESSSTPFSMVSNNDFWQKCVYSDMGCGTNDKSGWILAFAPFKDGQWILNHPNDIVQSDHFGNLPAKDFRPSATVEVPILLKDTHKETMGCIVIKAGGFVYLYDQDENSITPSYDLSIIELSNEQAERYYQKLDMIKPETYKGPVEKIGSKVVKDDGNDSWVKITTHGHTLQHMSFRYHSNNTCDVCHRLMIQKFDCDVCRNWKNTDKCIHCGLKADFSTSYCARTKKFLKISIRGIYINGYRCINPACDYDCCIECALQHKEL